MSFEFQVSPIAVEGNADRWVTGCVASRLPSASLMSRADELQCRSTDRNGSYPVTPWSSPSAPACQPAAHVVVADLALTSADISPLMSTG